MKRIIFMLCILLMHELTFGQSEFEISGTFKTPIKGYLKVYYEDSSVDSVPIAADGKFKYLGNAELPARVSLGISAKIPVALESVFVDEAPTALELDTVVKHVRFTAAYVRANFLKKSTFQEQYDQLKQGLSKLDKKDSLALAKGDQMVLQTLGKLKTDREKCLMTVALSHLMTKGILKNVYEKLGAEAKSSLNGVKIKNAFLPKIDRKIGDKIAHFAQADVNGKLVSVEDFKGKYLLIDFWASWCVPCRKENPNLVQTYQKYKEKGLEILGVSLDSEKAPWLAAIKADNLPWKHVSDLNGWNNEVSSMFKIKSVPSNILVDKEGNIIALDLRGEQLGEKLAKLLN